MVPGISNHEHARKWQPGNGGLCMHTIIRDGNRVHLGISTGGHYLSEDGGETFSGVQQGRRRRLRARSLSRVRSVRAQDRAATTTRPAGSTCRTTADGRIGPGPGGRGRTSACCAATTTATRGDRSPRDCRRTSDFRSSSTRTTPTRSTSCRSSRRRAPVRAARPRCGAARTAATRGAGSREGCRRSRATSRSCATRWTSTELKTPALYFGTTTGQLWIGREGGEKWDCLFDSLPPIHNVKVAWCRPVRSSTRSSGEERGGRTRRVGSRRELALDIIDEVEELAASARGANRTDVKV